MGNAADGGESAPQSNDPVDVAQRCRELHAAIAELLGNDALLAKECDRLMPMPEKQVPVEEARYKVQKEYQSDSDVEEEYDENDEYEAELVAERSGQFKAFDEEYRISPQDLRKVTQCLIDRLGCRQPDVLHRVTAVYAGFVGRREGLTVMEFRGYVACVLTQLQRELEDRCAAAGVRIVDAEAPGEQKEAKANFQMKPGPALQESFHQAENFPQQVERREATDLYASYEPSVKMENDLIQHSVPSNICTVHLPSNTKVDTSYEQQTADVMQQVQPEISAAEHAREQTVRIEEEEEVSELQMLTRKLDALNKSLSSVVDDDMSLSKQPLDDSLKSDNLCINFDGLPDLVAATLSNSDIIEVGTTKPSKDAPLELTAKSNSALPQEQTPSSNVSNFNTSSHTTTFTPAKQQSQLAQNTSCSKSDQPQPDAEFPVSYGPMRPSDAAAMSCPRFVNGHAEFAPTQRPVSDNRPLPGPAIQSDAAATSCHRFVDGHAEFAPTQGPMSVNRQLPGPTFQTMAHESLPTNFGPEFSRQHLNQARENPYAQDQLSYGAEFPPSAFCGIVGPQAGGFAPPPPSPPQSPRQKGGVVTHQDAHSVGQSGAKRPLTAKDLGVTSYGSAVESECTHDKDQEVEEDGASLVNGVVSRFKATGSNIATGWQKFADTMDTIFVPEGVERDETDVDEKTACEEPRDDIPQIESLPLQTGAPSESHYCPSMQHQMPMAGMMPQGVPHPSSIQALPPGMLPPNGYCQYGPNTGLPPQQAPGDVPLLFRTPSHEEVRDLLELEGMPAYIKLDAGRGFTAKRLCLDNTGETLYVLEADSPVPSFFFGITGFSLEGLRRVRHSVILSPEQKPLVSLEFDAGYLMMKLGDPKVFQGFLGVVTSCRDTVDIVAQTDWV